MWEHLMLPGVHNQKPYPLDCWNKCRKSDDDNVKLCNEKKYVVKRMNKSALELLVFLIFSLTFSL